MNPGSPNADLSRSGFGSQDVAGAAILSSERVPPPHNSSCCRETWASGGPGGRGRVRSGPVGLELKGVKAREGDRRRVPLTLYIVTKTPRNEASPQGRGLPLSERIRASSGRWGDAFVKLGH